jgi:hypothetical protein
MKKNQLNHGFLLRGYFAMVSSSFDTKRIQSIDAGKDATSLVSRLVTELDRILHPDFFRDLFERYPSLKYRNVFIAMNWLKTYQTMHVMTAMWGDCEEVIAPMVEEYVEKFASLKESKIRLDRFKDEPIIVFSIDNVHFSVEEFALDPSNKWFNHKQGGAGEIHKLFVCAIILIHFSNKLILLLHRPEIRSGNFYTYTRGNVDTWPFTLQRS